MRRPHSSCAKVRTQIAYRLARNECWDTVAPGELPGCLSFPECIKHKRQASARGCTNSLLLTGFFDDLCLLNQQFLPGYEPPRISYLRRQSHHWATVAVLLKCDLWIERERTPGYWYVNSTMLVCVVQYRTHSSWVHVHSLTFSVITRLQYIMCSMTRQTTEIWHHLLASSKPPVKG